MKKFFKDIDQKWKAYALAGCVCILFFLLLSNLSLVFGFIANFFNVFKTVIIGAVIAYIINPLAVLLEKKLLKNIKKPKGRWTLAVIITFLIILIVIGLLSYAVFPQIVKNIASLINNVDRYVDNLINYVKGFSGSFAPAILAWVENFTDSETGMLNKLIDFLGDNLDVVLSTTTNIGNTMSAWAIGAIFALYFLLAKESFKRAVCKLLQLLMSSLEYVRCMDLLSRFHLIFSKYIVFEIIDALIIGAASYIFMLITRMSDAAFISLLAAITNLIPTFGPIIGAAIAAFILLLVQPGAVLGYLIFVLIIQLLDSYVIKPKLFGNALNVPGVLILVAIIVFGKLMGIKGMLLAIPFAAILVYIYTDLFIPYLELKKDLKKYNKESDKNSAL